MARAFVLGLLLGILSAVGFLELGVPGLALMLIGVIWSLRYPWALSSVSGLLIGIGASVLVLITAANLRCAAANQSGPGFQSACTPPDSSALVTLATVVLVVGLATGLFVARGPIAARVRQRARSSPD